MHNRAKLPSEMRLLLGFLLCLGTLSATFPQPSLRAAVLQSGVDKLKDILLPGVFRVRLCCPCCCRANAADPLRPSQC